MAWQWLLRDWAQRTFHRATQQAVQSTLAAEAAKPAREIKQRACDVGVVFALPIEAGPFTDRLDGVLSIKGTPTTLKQGGLQGRNVVVAISGPGQQAAANAADVLLLGHRPQVLLTAGFAGGLTDELTVGDFLLADRIIKQSGPPIEIANRPDTATLTGKSRLLTGPLLTGDRIVRLPTDKRRLAEQHQALAVDLETYAVAEMCRRRETRCVAVRVISDSVHDELPADIEHLMNQATLMGKLGALTGTLSRRPSRAKDLWKLRETAVHCADRLAKLLAELVVQLVPRR